MNKASGDPRDNYYLAADVRELDRLAIDVHGIPGFTLMQRAAQAAFEALQAKWPDAGSVVCYCGSGNNAGDGYLVAALAAAAGLSAQVIAVGKPENLHGDAKLAFDSARDNKVEILPFRELSGNSALKITPGSVVVDALLGTGLSGEVRGDYIQAIGLVNTSNCPVLAIDIPSGLCSDTGRILGTAVSADLTVTFIGRKLGQVTGDGPQACGEVIFDDLAVPGEIYSSISPATP